ncbi:MAG: LytTR family transcriptional regulator [Clostridiales bacterium]|nr:LytTR family transcriptional regulator [Clostridiales bacterium]
MRVNIDISPENKETHAVIYTDKMTEEVRRASKLLEGDEAHLLTAQYKDDIVILRPGEIYMVRVEDKDTVIYGREDKYFSRKRLYEISDLLGAGFMQISKSTLVNLSYLDRIEPGFGGTVLLKLRNGSKDYVSRKYLPEFKRYLGL